MEEVKQSRGEKRERESSYVQKVLLCGECGSAEEGVEDVCVLCSALLCCAPGVWAECALHYKEKSAENMGGSHCSQVLWGPMCCQ